MTTVTRKVWCEKTRQYLMMDFEVAIDLDKLPVSAIYGAARNVQGKSIIGYGTITVKRVGKGLERP